MKYLYIFLAFVIIAGGIYYFVKDTNTEVIQDNTLATSTNSSGKINSPVTVNPINHASAVLDWAGESIYMDPVGDVSLYINQNPANIVLITDIHADHLNADTINKIIGTSTATLVVPQAVKDKLPKTLANKAVVMKNGDVKSIGGFSITAIPMYNLPESTTSPHIKGRGNGYLLERDGFRVYIAGDTSGIPEMRALTDIDIAFIPMNLPYTMSVDEAADAVLNFRPRQVWPYHYRGENGLSDVNKFKNQVNLGDPDIDVVLGKWY